MIEKILEWSEKGFHIGFYSVFEKDKLQWIGNFRVGNSSNFNFPIGDKVNGYRTGGYATIEEALNACFEACENYKPKKK